jgi:hypothetical protein
MIFGGAGHANHVGFVQTAHLYDEDLSEAGSDRDELEDLEVLPNLSIQNRLL